MESGKAQETDTHWRCKNGKVSELLIFGLSFVWFGLDSWVVVWVNVRVIVVMN